MTVDMELKTKPSELSSYIDAGLALFPLGSGTKGKAPLYKGWRTESYSYEHVQEHMFKGNNVGVRLDAGWMVVDIDPRNAKGEDGAVKNLDECIALFFELTGYSFNDDLRLTYTGGGGAHFWFRKPPELKLKSKLNNIQWIDVKTEGGFVLAAGSVHPKTGKLYEWDFLYKGLNEAPMASEKLLELARKDLSSKSLAQVKPGLFTGEEIEMILTHIDVEEFRHAYDDWFKLMAACHHASGGGALEEFVSWSVQDPVYSDQEDEIRYKWSTLSLNREDDVLTYKTLRYILKGLGKEHVLQGLLAQKDFNDDANLKEVWRALAIEGCTDKLVEEMNKSVAAVVHGKDMWVMVEDVDPYTGKNQNRFLLEKAFKSFYMNLPVLVNDGNKTRKMSAAEMWLAHPSRRSYMGLFMHPNLPREHYGKFNMWTGWGIQPQPGDWSLMKELIHDVLCDSNDHLYDYVLKWIALMLQKPWIKPEVALVLRGDEGTGKGTFGRALLKIAGNHGLTIANSRQLIGDFNIHLAGKIYLFADEAFWPGEKKGLGNLKALITEEDFSFEGKGVDPVFDKCFLHVVMASNEDWVVPAGINSRRFCILDVSDSKRGDHAFFKALNHQLRNGGLEGMAHDLMNLDIEGWHPAHNIPRTKALADQIVASLPDVYKWLLSLVDAESLPIMNNRTDWKKAPVRVYSDGKDDLVSAYDDYLQKKKRHFEDPSKTSIYKAGSKAFGFTSDKKCKGRFWDIPCLEEVKKAFCQYIKDPTYFD